MNEENAGRVSEDGVRIKPLEWKETGPGSAHMWASTVVGKYTINVYAGMRHAFQLNRNHGAAEYFDTEQEAKAAAFDHYRNAILSCIEPLRPATEQAGGEVVAGFNGGYNPDGSYRWHKFNLNASPLEKKQVELDCMTRLKEIQEQQTAHHRERAEAAEARIFELEQASPAATQSAVVSEDDLAALLWKTDGTDAGVPQSVIDRRTRAAFDDEAETTKDRWRKFARVALAALSNPGASQ